MGNVQSDMFLILVTILKRNGIPLHQPRCNVVPHKSPKFNYKQPQWLNPKILILSGNT